MVVDFSEVVSIYQHKNVLLQFCPFLPIRAVILLPPQKFPTQPEWAMEKMGLPINVLCCNMLYCSVSVLNCSWIHQNALTISKLVLLMRTCHFSTNKIHKNIILLDSCWINF